MICTSCSAAIPDQALFCSACGQSVSSVSQAPTGLASPSVARAAQRPASSSKVGRLASSDSIDGSGFTPGEVLIGRYRVIGLLGRGGMGEVYRADDLKLGQPVALKFLPRPFALDKDRIERFYAEVRNARQVSHPNVCRVYDVGEIDGQQYLSMEYVDGEDLASLLRRIGRLPSDKALEIARELCAGLAAAHDKGVLHRDLKPANIMIDGRGRARITDFGLAVAANDVPEGEVSGTPAYMAPELLAGKSASVRSDVYALGLVLYELSTGRKAFDGASLQELRRKRTEDLPRAPSALAPGFDPAVERVILRCLQKDPSARPASVAQVAAALPGGDPLAAALAAGETPSPEMVAAAGGEGALEPRHAWMVLGGVLAVLAAVLVLAPFATDFGLAPLPKSPELLEDRARQIARELGYAGTPGDSAAGWNRQDDQMKYLALHYGSTQWRRELDKTRPHPWRFWYRESPRPLIGLDSSSGVAVITTSDPPLDVSGMVIVELDARGSLMGFRTIPPQLDESRGPWLEPDWKPLLSEAGLDPSRLTSSEPRWVPPMAFDERAEWNRTYEGQFDIPIHVVAAAFHGRPVYFDVLGPWSRPRRMEAAPRTATDVLSSIALVVMILSVLVGGAILARRNVRLQRGDRRGAFVLAVLLLGLTLAGWLLDSHRVADLDGEFSIFLSGLVVAVFSGAFRGCSTWPSSRRSETSPELLISWSRLVGKSFAIRSLGVMSCSVSGSEPSSFLSCIAPGLFRPGSTSGK